MSMPTVSVVTSVYNAGPYLRLSLESVLGQGDVDIECIVIDDGSTDASSEILAEMAARDSRLRIFTQENRGLTLALIRGCAEARGELIARHDCDDLSLPGRLAAEARRLRDDPSLALVSCWSYGIGPAGEMLLEQRRAEAPAEATRELLEAAQGPPGHGSAMFRAETYRRVGGYRREFRVAQDWDLWLRLLDAGRCAFVPAFLYAYRIGTDSISARKRNQQTSYFNLARRCWELRTRGQSDRDALANAEPSAALRSSRSGRFSEGAAEYFIGKCLLDRRDKRAVTYLSESVRQNPFHLRARLARVMARLVCHDEGMTLLRAC
jgi:glycosyltransferase involved in cell wall biosynthesis